MSYKTDIDPYLLQGIRRLDLPAPASFEIQRAADILWSGERAGTVRLAKRVGLSSRTLERRFSEETGLSVANWGRVARLLRSLKLLASGQSVQKVGEAVGYSGASSFIVAFRRAYGETPLQYAMGRRPQEVAYRERGRK